MSDAPHTLYAWVRGAYPRRIAYQLLLKGIVPSPAALLAGETVLQNFKINVASFQIVDGNPTSVDADPSDPKPDGKSSPCLRITDPATGSEQWIHESSSIAWYIEDVFTNFRPLVGSSPADRAAAHDMIALINLCFHDASYYLRHAAAVTSFWSRLSPEDRSSEAAVNAALHMNHSLVKLQTWAEQRLRTGGWLTPGIQGPGIVDACLAGPARALWLGYSFEVFGDERLVLLKEWFQRFRALKWWDELECKGDAYPPELSFGPECRDV